MTLHEYKKTTYARHYEDEPQVVASDGSRTWITRGANLVISITSAKAGTVLTREGNADEYMVILQGGASADLVAGDETRTVGDDTLSILPPGRSEIIVRDEGTVLRIFSNRATDLAAEAVNAEAHKASLQGYAPLVNWPDPVGGFRIRTYDLSMYHDRSGPLIQPRIFRSTNLMVNVFAPWHALRETSKLGPHHHDDFEQASVCLKGKFVHHIRYPWTADLSDWYPDEHTEIGSPSVTVIPPPLVHTTRNASADGAILVDAFAPPRVDFSLKPGFVLNAEDYPLPEGIDTASVKLAGNVSAWKG